MCCLHMIFFFSDNAKQIDNYKNKKSIITMGRQNVTSESTPSGPLTS